MAKNKYKKVFNENTSLAQALMDKNDKLVKEIEERAKKGEVVRIM